MSDFLKKMTPSEVGRLGALARQGKYKAKKKELKGRKKASPEEAAAAREAKRRQEATDNRATVMAEFGSFGRQTLPDLEAMASGKELTPEAADGMVMAGLAEKLSTGQVVLSAQGKRLYNAASRGDVGAAKDAIDRAEASAGERIAKEKTKGEKDKAKAAEKEKPKAGGGGGGGGKDKPKPEEKDKAAERAKTAQDTAAQLPPASRIKPREVDALRRATTGDDVDEAEVDGLIELGFVQPKPGGGFEATDQGRAAHTALERGNRSQYEAAIQNARGRMEREGAAQQRKKDAGERATTRLAEKERREAERQTRRKRMDRTEALRVLGETQKGIAMELDTIVDTLTAVAVALEPDDDAVKAGRRNSSGDQAKLDEIYAAAAAICDLCEALGATQDEDEPSVEIDTVAPMKALPPAEIAEFDDVVTALGDAVKAIGDGWVGGYLVKFSDPVKSTGDLTHYRDMFLPRPDTDYGNATKSDVYVHHRQLPGLGRKQLRNQAEIGFDDAGVFIKHLLDMRDDYERKLYGLAQQGKLGWSSGTAPHLMERKALDDGRHVITRWPLGLDASYTPTPAGGLDMTAAAFKALLAEIGLDAIDSPEATDPNPVEVAQASATKTATDDRARRLLLTLDVLALETA